MAFLLLFIAASSHAQSDLLSVTAGQQDDIKAAYNLPGLDLATVQEVLTILKARLPLRQSTAM